MSNLIKNSVRKALLAIMNPLVKFLLRNGITHKEASDLMKWAYVKAAEETVASDYQKIPSSKISVVTGIQRKEVTRLRNLPEPLEREAKQHENRSSRVIGGWLSDSDFSKNGKALVLPIEEGKNSFFELVKRYGGDVPAPSVLDDLVKMENVSLEPDQKVRLLTNGYQPKGDHPHGINILGREVSDLLKTIHHNLSTEKKDTRLQISVQYDNLSKNSLYAIKDIIEKDCSNLAISINDKLRSIDGDTPNVNLPADEEQIRAGFGFYYFEDTPNITDKESL